MSPRVVQLLFKFLTGSCLILLAFTKSAVPVFAISFDPHGTCSVQPTVRLCHADHDNDFHNLTLPALAAFILVHLPHHDQDIVPPFTYNDWDVVGTHFECPSGYSEVGPFLCRKFDGHHFVFKPKTLVVEYDCVTKNYAGKNWPSGQSIWENDCEIATPTPTPSPTPICTPTPTPTPEPNETPTPTPTPTIQPASGPTPTPGPSQPGKESRLANDSLCVNGNFEAIYDLKDSGTGVKDAAVTFEFNGSTKQVQTNQDGRARTTFQAAAGTVKASADGYPTQFMTLTDPGCTQVFLDPDKTHSLKSARRVLGATTLAATGTHSVLGWLGFSSLLAGLVSFWYYLHDERV